MSKRTLISPKKSPSKGNDAQQEAKMNGEVASWQMVH
jgi:hypothetical protein